MNKVFQFFKDVKAVLKVFRKLIHQDVLVDELGYAQKEEVYSYTMGNKLVNELINQHLFSFIEKYNFHLEFDNSEGFYLHNEKFFIKVVDQQRDGIELSVFVIDFNTRVTYEMWRATGINVHQIPHNFKNDSFSDRLAKQVQNGALLFDQAYNYFQDPSFMEAFRDSDTKFWRS